MCVCVEIFPQNSINFLIDLYALFNYLVTILILYLNFEEIADFSFFNLIFIFYFSYFRKYTFNLLIFLEFEFV